MAKLQILLVEFHRDLIWGYFSPPIYITSLGLIFIKYIYFQPYPDDPQINIQLKENYFASLNA